jgi:hypothetical protein
MKVVCWYEICGDGSSQWEMVEADGTKCIEYFRTKDAAIAYAKENGLEIIGWEYGTDEEG